MLRSLRLLVALSLLLPMSELTAEDMFEGFESGLPALNSTNHAPPGATLQLNSGDWYAINLSPTIGTTGVYSPPELFGPWSGTGAATMDYEAAMHVGETGTDVHVWLMSPVRTFRNGDVISFYTRTNSGETYPDRVYLKLSLAGASTVPADFSRTLLSVNPGMQVFAYPEGWVQVSATITGLSAPASGRFAFHYDTPDNYTNANLVSFDNVQHQTGICRVAIDGQANAMGLGWNSATTLDAALAQTNGKVCNQIWLKSGVYLPISATQHFAVTRPLRLFGGFVGTEQTAEQRGAELSARSILSGDLDQNDNNADGNQIAELWTEQQGVNADRVLQITCPATSDLVAIDRLTVTAAANQGIAVANTCGLTIQSSQISGNGQLEEGFGGLFAPEALVGITKSLFLGNAGFGGGGLTALVAQLKDNLFQANRGGNGGAALVGTLEAINSTFVNNQAAETGGALMTENVSALVHLTFVGNSALEGGALFAGNTVSLQNSLFFGNTASNLAAAASVALAGQDNVLSHNAMPASSCLSGLTDCSGSLNADPDLRPLGPAGGLWPTLMPRSGSIVINAGDTTACEGQDARGVIRPQGSACDIGAIERRSAGYTLTVAATLGGTINATPAPVVTNDPIIDCRSDGGDCVATYSDEGNSSDITLTAAPDDGFEFSSWSGDCTGLDTSTAVVLDGPRMCRALFTPSIQLFASGFE